MTVPQTDEAAIKDVVFSLRDCWNRHDMEAFAQLFDQEADFVNVVGAWWKGRSEIRQALEDSHATMFKDRIVSVLETSVRFLKPDVARADAMGTGGYGRPARGCCSSSQRYMDERVGQE